MTISADDLEHVRFARGWLLARTSTVTATPRHWRTIDLPHGWFLHADTPLDVAMCNDADGRWVAVLGHVVDLDTGATKLSEVADGLLTALAAGRDHFLHRLDALAGRHVVLRHDGRDVWALTDAGGLRSVHYAPWTDALASHALLLRDHTGRDEPSAPARPGTRELLKYGWPGRTTAWRGVHLLTPNTEVDAHRGEVRRIHPRTAPDQAKVAEVAEVADLTMQDLRRHAAAIAPRPHLCVSLTAGLDSRVTLAALLPWRTQLTFFTYHAGPAHDVDVAVASDIARRLGLRHEVLGVRPATTEADERFRVALLDNSQYVHHPRVADAYRQRFGGLDALHVRSNLGEIGRCFYQPASDRPRPCTPASLAAAYAGGREELATHPAIVSAFTDWARASDLRDGHGSDPYDLQYWEHRMGSWHAAVVMESDPAFETTVLWNDRRTLTRWLSVDRAERRSGAVFARILQDHLPELADVPINPRA